MATTVHYPIAAASRLAGLSIDTVRAWERRYAAVVPERGAKGRLYTEAQVVRLRRLSALVRRGHAISDVAGLPDAQLAQWLAREGADEEGRAPERGAPDASPVSRILEAIDRFDDRSADREVARLAAFHPSRAFAREIALPLMREAGERWHRGSWSPAQEHMLSAVLRTVVAGVARLEPASDEAPRLAFATPEGEQHEFGILAAAMLASGSRLGVIYLGASLPPGEIAAAVGRTEPAAVVIGLTGASAAAAGQLAPIRRLVRPRTEVWAGGPVRVLARVPAAVRRRVVPLESFDEYERHLARIGAR